MSCLQKYQSMQVTEMKRVLKDRIFNKPVPLYRPNDYRSITWLPSTFSASKNGTCKHALKKCNNGILSKDNNFNSDRNKKYLAQFLCCSGLL